MPDTSSGARCVSLNLARAIHDHIYQDAQLYGYPVFGYSDTMLAMAYVADQLRSLIAHEVTDANDLE